VCKWAIDIVFCDEAKKRLFRDNLLFGGNRHYFGGKNQAKFFIIWENI